MNILNNLFNMKAKKPVSLPKLKAKALKLFTEVVKLQAKQDGKLRCFTCDSDLQFGTSNCQLGHFLPRGGYPGLTFEPNNSRLQCYRCNVMLHGNTFEFRERLIFDIGLEAVERLEKNRHVQVKWSRSDLHEFIDQFSAEIKQLQ
jgi:hypothetical protein